MKYLSAKIEFLDFFIQKYINNKARKRSRTLGLTSFAWLKRHFDKVALIIPDDVLKRILAVQNGNWLDRSVDLAICMKTKIMTVMSFRLHLICGKYKISTKIILIK